MLRHTTKLILLGALAFGVASPLASAPAEAAAARTRDVTVTLTNITQPIVPKKLIRGDREFDGGPEIDCYAHLYVTKDKRHVQALISFKAEEPKGDHSTVKETFHRRLYTAPAGKKIEKILDWHVSRVQFRSEDAGFQILGPGEDFKQFIKTLVDLAKKVIDAEQTLSGRDRMTPEGRQAKDFLDDLESGAAGLEFAGNHVHTQHPTGGPVSVFAIVGDTGGDDISRDRNGKDDTRIQSIMFKPLRIRLSG